MPINQPMRHSFDGGRTWLEGRPTLAQERDWPGTIRYRIGGAEPQNQDTQDAGQPA